MASTDAISVPRAPVVLTMTAPPMPVVMMMVPAETLTQVHDGGACCGDSFLRHIGGLGRQGDGSDQRHRKHGTRDGGSAREFRE